MWFPEGQLRIWLYNRPTDLRKSFDGLSALARSGLGENPVSGQVFVFLNRKRTLLKALYFLITHQSQPASRDDMASVAFAGRYK